MPWRAGVRKAKPSEDGFMTPTVLMAVGFSMLLFVAFVNLVLYQYGRGAVRSALDEGARAGSAAESTAARCEDKANEVLGSLLSGSMGQTVVVTCTVSGGAMVANGTGLFPHFSPFVPDFPVNETAVAVKEQLP